MSIDFLDHCKDVMKRKGGEYSTKEERYHNFKEAAKLQGITPEKALLGMMSKHVISVYDMVKSGYKYDSFTWDEKIGDCICYLALLRGLINQPNEK